MIMKNIFPNRKKIELQKMCKKPSRDGKGDLCISVWDDDTTASGYQIDKDVFLDFVMQQYKKDILERLKWN